MQKVIDFEFQFWDADILATKFLFELDKFVLKFDSEFPLTVQIMLEFLFSLLKFLPLIFQHEFDFSEVMFLSETPLIYI